MRHHIQLKRDYYMTNNTCQMLVLFYLKCIIVAIRKVKVRVPNQRNIVVPRPVSPRPVSPRPVSPRPVSPRPKNSVCPRPVSPNPNPNPNHRKLMKRFLII